jgi:hypothetical protein
MAASSSSAQPGPSSQDVAMEIVDSVGGESQPLVRHLRRRIIRTDKRELWEIVGITSHIVRLLACAVVIAFV